MLGQMMQLSSARLGGGGLANIIGPLLELSAMSADHPHSHGPKFEIGSPSK
jgi:hypothetical protein